MAEAIVESVPGAGVKEPANAYTAGNEADFERLYQASYGKILGTLTGMLGDRAAAEDCAQDAFVQAFRAWRRWRPDAPAEAWIHRIAVNRAISYRRRAQLRTAGELLRRLGRPPASVDPAAVASRPDVVSALRLIPPRLAAAIVLRHYHGYNNREIAAAIGVSERTVGTRLRQAAERLRAILDPDFSLGRSSALSSESYESYVED